MIDLEYKENQSYIRNIIVVFIEQIFNISYLNNYDSQNIELGTEFEELAKEVLLKEDIDGLYLGELYQNITSSKYKKKNGQVYTPKELAIYMIENSIRREDVIKNPRYKVLDPSCGSGFFIVLVYRKLLDIFTNFREDIICEHPYMKEEYARGIEKYIVDNCIYGVDVDRFSADISTLSLKVESGIYSKNIVCRDMLLDEYNHKFDLLIGNPPYIGVKNLDSDYKKRLKKRYRDVYTDKSDISYCFFHRAYDLLYDGGILNLINSRYMIEAKNAEKLRGYILEKYNILKMLDFYGENIFKGISISPAIFMLEKTSKYNKRFRYGRPRRDKFNNKKFNLSDFDVYWVNREQLDSSRWILERAEVYELFNKIDSKGNKKISDILSINQGIITGCDKAFIVDKSEADRELEKQELKALKPWVKNSQIGKYRIGNISKYIIYTDRIEDYENLYSRLEEYRDILENRRECKNGIKKWYQIQWGRDENIFNGKRILFPYKSGENRFSLTSDQIYHSADVYSAKLKEDFKGHISEEYIVAYLNSSLFEFYFKIITKKVGSGLYEYYPNRLNNMNIIVEDEKAYNLTYDMDIGDYRQLKEKIDSYFLKLYGIGAEEGEIIDRYIEDA